MIIETVTDEQGREVKLYRPENAADIAEIQRLLEAGKISISESMADHYGDDGEQDLIDAGILTPD